MEFLYSLRLLVRIILRKQAKQIAVVDFGLFSLSLLRCHEIDEGKCSESQDA